MSKKTKVKPGCFDIDAEFKKHYKVDRVANQLEAARKARGKYKSRKLCITIPQA